jgi:hypothetical protein
MLAYFSQIAFLSRSGALVGKNRKNQAASINNRSRW